MLNLNYVLFTIDNYPITIKFIFAWLGFIYILITLELLRQTKRFNLLWFAENWRL